MKTEYRTGATAFAAACLSALLLVAGCSSSSNGSSTSTPTSSSTAAPAVVTVSDAPLGNILSAKVTLSSVSLGASGGGSVTVVSKPTTIELSGLGSTQEPIEFTNVAFGTYNSVTVNVSAAQVTYVDTNGQVVTATATIGTSGVTVALNPALTIASQGEVHLHIGFNLSQSFSISGSTVTFTPAINTSGAQVEKEDDAHREIEAVGKVTAISSSSITVQSGDSGNSFTFVINGSTQYPSGVTASSIAVGAFVQIQGQTQTDGTLLALSITPLASGESGHDDGGAKGIVVSVTQDSSGHLTGFSMVPQQELGSMAGMSTPANLNVVIASSTTYSVNEDAKQLGLTDASFSAAEIFPGQAVTVSGTADSSGNLNAAKVMLAAENVPGTLAATPQASGTNLNFAITVQVPSFLNTYDKLVTLNAVAGANTSYGNGMSASSFATNATGTAIQVHGYLLMDQNHGFLLYADEIAQAEKPEAPEGN